MKVKLEDLIELAEKIENDELRNKTVKLLKHPNLSNKSMDYKASKLEKIPSWIGAHHSYEGGLIEHIYSVTKLSIKMARVLEQVYEKKVNKDLLICGALLHDLSKVFILKEENNGYSLNKHYLDHALWSACELYSRNFPEEVVEIVIGHGGEMIAPNPLTLEATIVQLADNLDASSESIGKEDLVYILEEELA